MFTIEHDLDCTVVTTLDEGGDYEDVQVVLDDTTVFIAQPISSTERNQVLELSYQQFLDILTAMDLPEGAYYAYQKDVVT